ncbi:MAG: histidine phosphatase family protein [Burkholderiales bacterium 35-55-47]|jgi:phosphohistidine phosphatase|uniref:SixA phosphatase family protein n=1 Tax=Limnohabitans sp. TaxID=1907725 RepID=UPI000BD041FB|nr:histidine phosphatase family protein [Limnohabitans sp.]OYY18740.1 MAG: histidine phosphatase family protein [Burkholderiales bacterium 35-55-47]OYZ73558.1 MAG: histidine phosphatase family protein [Burkholderiales bacterium 24-55-52]OZB00704.1 MAG: histidine phosphatase family protein [Burkholderiales bacterium 39-55-53]HQR85545.1 histidine phosphatase family protein [Limnohabitans sp.]HQS26538.1 histidine phosphatase family protein [Limnohabitans sp.]
MDLILWRHAEAVEAAAGEDDLSRVLTKKGHRQAARMAAWLDRNLPEGTRVLVSPSVRTQETVAALGRKFKLRDELVPETSLDDVLALLKWDAAAGPQLKGSVLLVGHQPYLGQLVSRLLGMQEQNCPVRKGSVWWLRTRIRDGQTQTVLLTVACPELTSSPWDDRS